MFRPGTTADCPGPSRCFGRHPFNWQRIVVAMDASNKHWATQVQCCQPTHASYPCMLHGLTISDDAQSTAALSGCHARPWLCRSAIARPSHATSPRSHHIPHTCLRLQRHDRASVQRMAYGQTQDTWRWPPAWCMHALACPQPKRLPRPTTGAHSMLIVCPLHPRPPCNPMSSNPLHPCHTLYPYPTSPSLPLTLSLHLPSILPRR